MPTTTVAKGSCLCGATSITAEALSSKVNACHCNMCRKWSGGPYMAVDCGTEVSFEGEEQVAVFSSSEWADRGFCSRCGTHLFYRFKESQQYIMPASLFDEKDMVFQSQIFIDEKPEYYSFSNSTRNMTGQEVIEQFMESQT